MKKKNGFSIKMFLIGTVLLGILFALYSRSSKINFSTRVTSYPQPEPVYQSDTRVEEYHRSMCALANSPDAPAEFKRTVDC